MTAAQPSKLWDRDLLAVHAKQLTFTELTRRHAGLVAHMVRQWRSRCPANVGEDDLKQETWKEIWLATECWDPARGVPIVSFVRLRVNNRLLSYTDRLLKSREKDVRYLAHQICEEKIVVLGDAPSGLTDHGLSGGGSRYVTVTQAPFEENFDARARVARMLGALSSKQARVIAGVLAGEPTALVTRRVYGRRCRRPRKAALRALAAATTILESSSYPYQDERTSPSYATDEKTGAQTHDETAGPPSRAHECGR